MNRPYWIWTNEPSTDEAAIIYGVPQVIKELNLTFNTGELIERDVPLIEIVQDSHSQGVLTDNLIAAGAKGLVCSSRLRNIFCKNGVANYQQFPVLIRNTVGNALSYDYALINILGSASCIDTEKSTLVYHPSIPGYIEFIHSLVLKTSDLVPFDLFRSREVPELILVSDLIKRVCEEEGISGVKFYSPESYRL